MVGLTRASAVELGAHGITVNAVCPNHVTTGLGAKQNAYFAELLGFESVEAYSPTWAPRTRWAAGAGQRQRPGLRLAGIGRRRLCDGRR
jgi:NAD(P)-dependent dehydrogenase (short-subunit alcohol dehydrogenase family)